MGTPSSTSITRPPRHRRIRWRTKTYLSVAMVGALVIIALVAAISISLAPAHLTFSITDANIAIYMPFLNNHSRYTHLNFTLVANNSSPRTAVWYGPMTSEISYNPAITSWVRYVRGTDQLWPDKWQKQGPLSAVNFSFSVDYGYNENTPDALINSRILIVTKVRFARLGMLTLPYTIRFSCEPVNFRDNSSFPVMCA